MKNDLLKKAIPHLIAIAIFLVLSVLFCKPILDGNVLNQHDIVGWKGMAQNAFDYKEKHGHFPLWNPALFSGMPNYLIAMDGKSILPDTTRILSLWLPRPMNFFFLACICFYILGLSLRLRPVVGILASIAFAFSTYNAVIINAGHETQMIATAYMPLLLAGLVCIFEKRYWLGLALTSFGTYHEVIANHVQITYYFLLIALAVTISYAVQWIRRKDWRHLGLAAGITAVSALVGLSAASLALITSYDYAKYTMRGGKNISIEGDKVTAEKTSGLDTAYAFQYSVSKGETATLIMANAFGGSTSAALGDDSHVVGKLTALGVPESNAAQVASSLPKYWGGLPFTSGPAYLGVIVCLLGLIGFVVVKSPLRWGLLAATIFGILLSWGRYLPGFNAFLFEHLPLYNKFRAPSMAQVIPQLTVCVSAALALQQLLFVADSREWLQRHFKTILYTVGGLSALLLLMYLFMDYSSPIDSEIAASISQQAKNDQIGRAVVSGMKEDRHSMFGGQLLRTLAFAALTIGLLYAYMKKLTKPLYVAIALVLVSSIELIMVSNQYLNADHYVSPDEMANTNFAPTKIDQQILQDKDPHYRVFNASNSRFSTSDFHTSYYHKAVGGYHAARLRIYQDIIDKYLSSQPNPAILNMLNTKYIIYQDPQTGQEGLIPNDSAYGPVWLVKQIKLVDGPVQEIVDIGTTNLRDTAIVDKSLASLVGKPNWDSSASIRLVKFDNDVMEYESNAQAPQFAVFSEVYYPSGWNAYIDGKRVDYVKADYVLRGLAIPAGKHSISFKFEPSSYKTGVTISFIGSILVLIFLLGGLYMAWRQDRKPNPQVQ